MNKAAIAKWRRDPVAFITEVLIDPETGQRFELYEEEKTFLRQALTLTPDGRLPFPEMVFSAPKKSGKTGLAAMAAVYVAVVLAGNYGEIYCLANDYEQAASRVYQAAARIIEASPLLRGSARIKANRIEIRSTGTFIQACASDYTGFAGANPTLTICDELWGFVHESSRRLFDEAVPSPARKVSGRLVVTYAGFEGESDLLESLHKRGLAEPEIAPDLHAGNGILLYWTHRACAPWQTQRWLDEMRQSLRPNQYLRMIENQWTSTESNFVDMDWWDACVDPAAHMLVSDRALPIWVGVDASVKRDSTAIVACTWDEQLKRVRLVWHRVFQPSKTDPLDFEATIEQSLTNLNERFEIREARFDPYQLVSVAQRLEKGGLPMVEFPQSVPNLTEASSNLYEVIKGRNLVVYPDDAILLAVSRAVAIESSRGWRIAKEKVSHKIDVVVALAQAALGAVKGQEVEPGLLVYWREQAERAARAAANPNAPIEEPAEADLDLVREYEEAMTRFQGGGDRPSVCARCGQPFRGTSVRGSDGRTRHAECATGQPARYVEPGSPDGTTSDTGWTPAGFLSAKKAV